MRHVNQSSVLSFLGVASAVLLMPTSASAQLSAHKSRQGFTGQQLFEHEWKWVEPKPMPTNSVATRRVRSRDPNVANLGNGIFGDGLGPLHNATSCAQCHVAGGSSGIEHNVTMITVDPRSPALKNLSEGNTDLLELFPGLLGPRGALNFSMVVHDHSTRDGYAEIRNQLVNYVPGGVEDAWFTPAKRESAAIAKTPVVAGRHGTVDFYLSQRNSPALFGLGVIDRMNDHRIRHFAKQQAAKSNGEITGRFVGKFGWRGQINSLSEFVSQACAGELGLNQISNVRDPRGAAPIVTGLPSQAGDPADFSYANLGADIDHNEMRELVGFVSSLPRPSEYPSGDYDHDDVIQGEQIFGSIGCASCHAPDLSHVSGIFSDLLVHDMGAELQSPDPAPVGEVAQPIQRFTPPVFKVFGPGGTNASLSSAPAYYGSGTPSQGLPIPYPLARPEEPRFPRGDASATGEVPGFDLTWDAFQREWKTPPLWGVADTAPYLHDGRAATLEEAILWHGGEASSSRQRFADLSEPEQTLVIAFLSSLRAPEMASAAVNLTAAPTP